MRPNKKRYANTLRHAAIRLVIFQCILIRKSNLLMICVDKERNVRLSY